MEIDDRQDDRQVDDRQAEEAEFAEWVKALEFSASEINRINELLKEKNHEQL